MESKEFGLVAAKQLFNLEHLHYGYWEKEEVVFQNLAQAQDRYVQKLIIEIEQNIKNKKQDKILDIGCGIGNISAKLLSLGYQVDSLVPSKWMAEQTKNVTKKYKNKNRATVLQCGIEDIDVQRLKQHYDVVFFSESYQYIHMEETFRVLKEIMKPQGRIIIFDFFRRDNASGIGFMGGGHAINKFYSLVKNQNIKILKDQDVTNFMSPNLKLLNDILVHRFLPFISSLNQFLSLRYPKSFKIIKYIFRKRLAKLKKKYSKNRSEENFIKHKIYKLIHLELSE